jgi:hypothetical protein
MKVLLGALAVVMLLLLAHPTSAIAPTAHQVTPSPTARPQAAPDPLTIEGQIAAVTGISRTVDLGFQVRAAACTLRMAAAEALHDCPIAGGEAEVIGYNGGAADPVAQIVSAWMASPEHHAILVNRSYTRIGCGATHVVISTSDRWFFDCYLAIPKAVLPPVAPLRPLPVPALIVAPPVLLPNTAFTPKN